MNPNLILASQSRWRIQILRDSGIIAQGIGAPIDEYSITHPEPVGMAEARALGKARSVAELHPEAWVIGADQVAWLSTGDKTWILEKPKSPQEHFEHLCLLRGKTHTLSTALVLITPQKEQLHVEHTRITMRSDLSDAELLGYVQSGEGAECCGGYQAEAKGALMIERIEGDWFNVIGLPLHALVSLLRQEGWRSPFAASSSQ